MASYVRYIDRTRDYYLSKGYDKPYQWAHFDDVPFTPLAKPLSESRVVLITTSDIAIKGVELDRDETAMVSIGGHYSFPADTRSISTTAIRWERQDARPRSRNRARSFRSRAARSRRGRSHRGLTKRFHTTCTA